jgi:hypothetical protein
MKNRKPTIDLVKKWIAHGDGQGERGKYHPFYQVRDVPSQGRSRMLLGLKTGRVHHFLSDIEYYFHLLSEYEPTVVDIREQYALLPWEKTQEIAVDLGIRHPTYPGTKTPIVMTSDQVITVMQSGGKRYGVICVKSSSALDPREPKTRRVLEKLLIEKTYWERRGIPWRVGTERDLPLTRVKNLDILRMSLVAKELDWLNPQLPIYVKLFMDHWTPDRPLLGILHSVASKLDLELTHSFALFARAVWLRHLPVDIDTEIIHHHQPLLRSKLGR